jgi:hypothetical protein
MIIRITVQPDNPIQYERSDMNTPEDYKYECMFELCLYKLKV